MQVQEELSQEEVVKRFNQGHGEMSGEIFDLLEFNFLNMQSRIRELYKDLLENSYLLDETDKSEINAFLDINVDFSKLTQESYFVLKQEIKEVEDLIYILQGDFSRNQFRITPDEENWVEKLMDISPKCQNLHVRGAIIGKLRLDVIQKIFANFPKGLKTLDIGNNKLFSIERDEFIELVKNLPNRLKVLDLSSNTLEAWLGRERGLIPLAENISRDLKELKLNNIDLGKMTATELGEFIGALPSLLAGLEISSAYLHTYKAKELMEIFSLLPLNLKKLDLSSNSLKVFKYKKVKSPPKRFLRIASILNPSENAMKSMFQCLPSKLEILSLSSNMLGDVEASHLIEAMEGLPPGLVDLDIGSNMIASNYSVKELKKLIQTLPRGLKRLNFRDDGFGYIESEKLKTIFTELPPGLEELVLGVVGLGENTKAEIGIRKEVNVVY